MLGSTVFDLVKVVLGSNSYSGLGGSWVNLL